MRLIDADAMKDTTDNVIAVIDPETKSKYWISLNDYINAQPTVPQFGQWISVKDGLPENEEYVLVHTSGKSVLMGFYDNDGWYTTEEYIRNVTHWMPLPERPKEAKNECEGNLLLRP